MHQQFQGLGKHKKQNNRKPKLKNFASKSTDSNLSENSQPESCELVLNSPVAPIVASATISATIPSIPIGTTPKKKVPLKTIPAQGIVAISGATLAPTNAQPTIPATVKLTQQPVIISSMSSLPVPALSSINSTALPTNPPPLINKISTTQKKTIVKPELVPIQQQMQDSNIEIMDIETCLENTPIIISKSPTVQNQAQITGLILDKNQKINTKIIGKPTIGIVSAAPTSAQIKVSTASGIQTVHVSPGHTLIKPHQGGQATLLQSGATQSTILANQIRRPQQTKALPPLVAAQSPTNHSYVIPISIGKNITGINKTFQPIVAQTTKSISPKTIKTSTVPILASTNNLQRTSLIHTQNPQIVTMSGNKTIIRTAPRTVPAGKSLINPAVVAANRQPQTMQIIQTKSMPQQNIIVSPSGANVLGGSSKATIVGTSSPIMVQKIIAVSKSGTPTTANVVVTTSPSICNVNSIGTTTPPGTSLINPQIIQIHQSNQDKSPATAKVQTISTANFSPLQQQSLLQSINKQIRVQGLQQGGAGQNLIIKPQQVMTQIQKQIQPGQIQLAPVQTSTSLIDAQIQLVSTSSGSITQPVISRPTVKAATNLIQTSSSPITSVRTVSANSPLIGKVITDQNGQIISLENLLQQKQMNMSSVRIAGAKPGQTNLIQLSGASGSQMSQYAVVSIPQPRLVSSEAAKTNAGSMSGQVVTVSGIRTTAGISAQSNVASSASKTEIVKIGGKTAMITQPTLIQGQQSNTVTPKIVQSSQLQPITAQQLVNAKVLQGFQGLSQVTSLNQRVKAGTSIRMVNASNLNLANIDGKQIIIAKNPTMMQSANQIPKSTIWTQQGNTVSTVGKTNIIGTLPTGQIQSSQVMFGNQIVKIQPQHSVSNQTNTSTPTMSVININANSTNNTGATATPAVSSLSTGTTRTVVIGSGGQAIKVHAPNMITTTANIKPTVKNVIKGTNLTTSPGQRVVLAVQGGSQFILPQNFQGGTINLKGLKMIPIQTQQTTQIQSNINPQITTTSQAIKPPNSSSNDS